MEVKYENSIYVPRSRGSKHWDGKDLYENYEEVRKIFNKASEITNIDIATLCFNGIKREYNPNEGLLDDSQTAEDLNKTENTQIAIATMSLAILEILKKKI